MQSRLIDALKIHQFIFRVRLRLAYFLPGVDQLELRLLVEFRFLQSRRFNYYFFIAVHEAKALILHNKEF
jgi:hypothetical protein